MIFNTAIYSQAGGAEPFSFTYTGDFTENRTENGLCDVTFNTSGTLDILSGEVYVRATITGGKGGGAYFVSSVNSNAYGASGGTGGTQTVAVLLTPGSYDIIIGAAGTVYKGTGTTGTFYGTSGGDTVAFGYTCTGGGRGGYKSASGGSVTAYPGSAGSPNGVAGASLTSGGNIGASAASTRCAGQAGSVSISWEVAV